MNVLSYFQSHVCTELSVIIALIFLTSENIPNLITSCPGQDVKMYPSCARLDN